MPRKQFANIQYRTVTKSTQFYWSAYALKGLITEILHNAANYSVGGWDVVKEALRNARLVSVSTTSAGLKLLGGIRTQNKNWERYRNVFSTLKQRFQSVKPTGNRWRDRNKGKWQKLPVFTGRIKEEKLIILWIVILIINSPMLIFSRLICCT